MRARSERKFTENSASGLSSKSSQSLFLYVQHVHNMFTFCDHAMYFTFGDFAGAVLLIDPFSSMGFRIFLMR